VAAIKPRPIKQNNEFIWTVLWLTCYSHASTRFCKARRLSKSDKCRVGILAFEGEVEDAGKQGVQLGGGLGLCGGYAVLLFHSFQSASVASTIVSAD